MAEDEDRSAIIAHFQEITGLEDAAESVQLLSAHNWDLESAVQATLNQREPPPPPPPPPAPSHTSHPLLHPYHPPSPPLVPHPVGQGRGPVQVHGGTWWQWLTSLALFPLRFIVNTATEVLSFIVQLIFGSRPQPALNPRRDVMYFLTKFERQYGTTHPDFLQCSYSDALADARQQLRFLLVYLHSPHHQDTPLFCRSVLASQEFTEYTRSSSLLCWAVGMDTEEGARVSNILRENTFPFVALICLKRSRMVVCERVEGRVGREDLVLRLQQAIRNNEAEMVAERFERQRRDQDKRIREEQDRAYAASLQADQAKRREREQQEAMEREREAREREREELEQKEQEEFVADRQRRLSRLPEEPTSMDQPTVLVSLRLPTGERMERRFRESDSLQSVYDFVYTSDSAPRQFTLVTNFPRKELHCEEGAGPELGQLGLGPKCVLFVQNDSD